MLLISTTMYSKHFDHIKVSVDIKSIIIKYLLPSVEIVKIHKTFCLDRLEMETFNVYMGLNNYDDIKNYELKQNLVYGWAYELKNNINKTEITI